SRQTKLYTAFFLIYFIWGSTYLAIRYAIGSIPPFLMAGTRFFAAGVLMFLFLRWRGVPTPPWSQWWRLGIVGVFLFLGGNGLVVWAEQYIDSGLAALLVSTLPLWLIVLDWLWAAGPPPKPLALIGIALGVLGTVVLIKPELVLPALAAQDNYLQGVPTEDADDNLASGIVIFASVLWAIGSIYTKKFTKPKSIFMSAACQMVGGGIALLLVALWQGEWAQFEPASVTLVSVAGFSYLLCFGSMVAISAYAWLLQNASAAAVSTYAFVNPIVALLLGWLIADEPMTAAIIAGAGIILVGVVLVIRTSSK
ncbi:MAG: EamA family transporter, partial [Pseudomonadota bacterium]